MAASDPRSIVTADALSVAPDLLGLPLAPPSRRLGAMLVDLVLLGIVSQAGGVVLTFAMALGLWRLAKTPNERIPFDRVRRGSLGCLSVFVLLAAVIALAVTLGSWISDNEATEAAETAGESAGAATRSAEPPAGDGGVPDTTRIRILEARTLELEEELRDATRGNLFTSFISSIADELGLVFGWGTIYFSVFLAWWNGQTPGKRLFRLRVRRLSGLPVTGWVAFERAGGYAAGLATGLLGFARIYWDANRQSIHDKIVSTVVVHEPKP